MNGRRIARRLLSFLLTLMLSTMILFTLIRFAPGDPIKIFLGTPESTDLSQTNYQERYESMEKELLLDRPLPFQYLAWLKKVSRFDLGQSIYSKQPVAEELLTKLPATLLLTVPAIGIQLVLGISLGIFSALFQNRTPDHLIRFFCASIASFPGFALGLILIYFFSVKLHWYEISTSVSLARLWLPTVTLGFISSPGLIRVVRTGMLTEMGKPYVGFLLSVGSSRGRILANIFSNMVLPIIAITSTTFANLIGGSVVIENVFSWPGVGKYAMESILKHDYPVVQGYGLLLILFVIAINLIVDITYLLFDPTIRQQGGPLHEE